MSPVQEFQKQHGAAFVKIVTSPAFNAAMLLLNLEKMQKITALTPEDIKTHGPEILADLCGHLKHENDLMALYERKTFDLSQLPEETYGAEEETTTTKRKRKKD